MPIKQMFDNHLAHLARIMLTGDVLASGINSAMGGSPGLVRMLLT